MSPTTPSKPISIPGASVTNPVPIPDTLVLQADGTYLADFNGDGVNDIVKDINNDGLIDPTNEIIENSAKTFSKINSSESSITLSQNPNTITFKAGPLPQVTVAKPVAYTFAIAQGVLLTGLAGYLAITKLTIFAGVKTRLGL